MIRRFTLRSVFVMLLALFFGQPMHLFAQNEEKLSAATYFFLKDRDAKDINKPTIKVKDITPDLDLSTLDLKGKRIEPLYAKPDTIDGKVYMSSFVRLENENSTSALEAKGVIVQGVFKNGLITALIPVDSIEAVATIANVKKGSCWRRWRESPLFYSFRDSPHDLPAGANLSFFTARWSQTAEFAWQLRAPRTSISVSLKSHIMSLLSYSIS